MPRLLSTAAIVAAATVALLSGGCASSSAPRAAIAASAAEQAVLIDRVASLEGEWQMTDDKGQSTTSSIFKVASGGSAVREIMFPGTDHEMTNVYHMDGPTLILTHYCAMGNQPRMRAIAGSPGLIEFKFDSVTNWAGGKQPYMGQMSLEFVDADHIVEHWWHIQDGKLGEPKAFAMTRKR
jgi:hypothetical protein